MVVLGVLLAEGGQTEALEKQQHEWAPCNWLRDLPEWLQPLTGGLPEVHQVQPMLHELF